MKNMSSIANDIGACEYLESLGGQQVSEIVQLEEAKQFKVLIPSNVKAKAYLR